MAKKSNLLSMLLGVALILALVYFLRPQTFDFLKQGFVNPDEDFEDDPELEDFEDFEDDPDPEPEGFYTEGGKGSAKAKMHPDINCRNKYGQIELVKGLNAARNPPPTCPNETTRV